MSSTPFAVPLVPLVLLGSCVDAMALASPLVRPLVRPLVVPFVRGAAEGILVNNTVDTE